ncbi:uncharacterized protein PFL1_00603 [Pseudozyma flocculosa PF-1]|uniref:Pre-mRNA-processing factor 19 n=1 Tax=Pseudozyma flocculosa TaxID=84751 RepID=A0A5C3EQH4_9BASI|nr:uncharacterized protein PFL1_00603 [Pseudozyma flocculosa PF-1]EPQ32407.1 hypothetical protein PFL1_00603 [Pseudozyma flocculosa PF-1]SPO34614.1 probable PRP19 - non-snRNP spliceosome component required for DNA repair [Pseudozyma flocculosa]
MFCAISGEPPKVAVVSKKSGLIYEQRLITNYINENGKDPVTGDELQLDDLIEIKSSPKTAIPRPPTHSSIPSLLTTLQNEYDAIIMESFTLKKHYDNLRQELAHALYANDASARVIARLMNERDQAREALANIQATIGAGGAAASGSRQTQDVEMAEEAPAAKDGGLAASVIETIDSTAQRLSAQRKAKSKRKAPEGYATAADIGSFAETQNIPSMHSTKPPGVTCLDVSADGNLIATGGNDKQVQIYDRTANKVLATLKGHTKKVTRVAIAGTADPPIGAEAAAADGEAQTLPAFVLSASEDKTIKVWAPSGSTSARAAAYKLSQTVSTHKGEVTGLDIHPSGSFFGSASRDGTWALHSVEDGSSLLVVDAPAAGSESEEEAKGGYEYESFAFHPDGQLAATGTADGTIRVWDIKQGAKVTTFRNQLQGRVSSLHFSENGYMLAASSEASEVVEVWDLRKLNLAGAIPVEGAGVQSVRFDPSLQFLAVVGKDVKVFANKSWKPLFTFDGNAAELTDARWDNRSGSLVVTGLDRTVRALGKADE